jgi:hypothetical protein
MLKAAARAVASGALGKRLEIDPVFALIEQHASDELQLQAFVSENAEGKSQMMRRTLDLRTFRRRCTS